MLETVAYIASVPVGIVALIVLGREARQGIKSFKRRRAERKAREVARIIEELVRKSEVRTDAILAVLPKNEAIFDEGGARRIESAGGARKTGVDRSL